MSGPLQTKLTADLKTALKAGEKQRLGVIRMVIADLTNEQIKLNRDTLEEAEEQAVLRRSAKMRREAAEAARQAGRTQTAEQEASEAAIVEAYLPQRLTEAEIEDKARALLAELGIDSRKEQGKFMKAWMERYRAVSDGKLVSQVLGRLLS